MKKSNRLGESKQNKWGSQMTIITYENAQNIIVKFDNGYVTNSRYDVFKTGQIKSPYDKDIFDKGFIGIGKYTNTESDSYFKWKLMMSRCYSEAEHKRYPHYIGCTVCEECLITKILENGMRKIIIKLIMIKCV